MFYLAILTGLSLLALFLLKPILFLENVSLPFFALPPSFLKVFLFGNFLFSLFANLSYFKDLQTKSFPSSFKKKTLLLYFFSFCSIFGGMKKVLLPFLALSTSFLFFLSLSLYEEMTILDQKRTFFLTPPILWNLYLMALAITTYLLNITCCS